MIQEISAFCSQIFVVATAVLSTDSSFRKIRVVIFRDFTLYNTDEERIFVLKSTLLHLITFEYLFF